MICVYDMIS